MGTGGLRCNQGLSRKHRIDRLALGCKLIRAQKLVVHNFVFIVQSNKSESSSEETSMHFTATVEGETRGPRAIGSYLSRYPFHIISSDSTHYLPNQFIFRREFGTVENGTSDSGYLSHSSGSHYPRVEPQVRSLSSLCHNAQMSIAIHMITKRSPLKLLIR
jgi:hypothetical protein